MSLFVSYSHHREFELEQQLELRCSQLQDTSLLSNTYICISSSPLLPPSLSAAFRWDGDAWSQAGVLLAKRQAVGVPVGAECCWVILYKLNSTSPQPSHTQTRCQLGVGVWGSLCVCVCRRGSLRSDNFTCDCCSQPPILSSSLIIQALHYSSSVRPELLTVPLATLSVSLCLHYLIRPTLSLKHAIW